MELVAREFYCLTISSLVDDLISLGLFILGSFLFTLALVESGARFAGVWLHGILLCRWSLYLQGCSFIFFFFCKETSKLFWTLVPVSTFMIQNNIVVYTYIAVKLECFKSIDPFLAQGSMMNIRGPVGQSSVGLGVKQNPHVLNSIRRKEHIQMYKSIMEYFSPLCCSWTMFEERWIFSGQWSEFEFKPQIKLKTNSYCCPRANEILKNLIEKRADVNFNNDSQQTPRHIAVRRGSLERVKVSLNISKSYNFAKDTNILEILATSLSSSSVLSHSSRFVKFCWGWVLMSTFFQ